MTNDFRHGRRFLGPVAVLALALTLCLPNCALAMKQAVLLLQWLPQAQFAGYYVAQDKGFYREAGVDLKIRAGGPDTLASRELAEGEVEFATMFLATGVQRRAEGMPIVHLAQIVQRSALMLVARKDSGIVSPRDLGGRRVSIWDNEFQLQPMALFQRLGVIPELVPQGSTVNLFLRGGVAAVSAMWYNEYHTLLASGLDPSELTVFSFSDLELNYPEDGIYCLQTTWDEDPEMCRAVVAATLRGWRYAFDNPEEALEIMLSRMREARVPANRAHQRWMLARMRDIVMPAGNRRGGGEARMGKLDRLGYQRMAAALLERGLIPFAPTYERFAREATP
ncbi:MAG: ABC transporter substrate-binding protein [Desulfovibrio aminophilus]|jgi:NitT/TauT family transport system substrate-binding protein|uniref:ABC transporter substrate-binding protein n=1 Tax=Desulfovibrio aminophilus TaxID=81425 RepID=UPI002A3A0973|nr:ABC transporter substrate-binding protein [Desulfovibrionaceae bacterium]